MSWITRSIANSFQQDNENDLEEEEDSKLYIMNNNTIVSNNKKHEQQVSDYNLHKSSGAGVKQDLSEITKALTRQFWGVTSLIASNERSESSDREPIAGIRRDFAEIGGRFRSGILKVSNNVDVSGIKKLASDFLQMESEDEDSDYSDGDGDDAVGVSDDVVAFAGDIAMHPETWLEFPLPEDEDDGEEFDLSDAQQEHVSAVEHLAPRLCALKNELCPNYMNESSFWKIYFVLLHPRLDRHAAELLSTPKIVKARALLAHESKNRRDSENTASNSKSKPFEVSAIETIKHPIKSDDIQIVDKSVIQEESHERKDVDDRLKKQSSEIITNRVAYLVDDNDHVSFSDLDDDDDDDDDIPIQYKRAAYTSNSTKDSSKQVSVRNSETKESNDWLDVEIDVA